MSIRTFFVSLAAALVLSTSTAFAGFQMTLEEKLADFDQLNSQIEAHYGPKLYKKDSIRLDLSALRSQYRATIAKSTTNAEFYYSMVKYVAEFKDGHFSIRIPTDYTVSLPIHTDLVENRVLIDAFDATKFKTGQFPFQRGDEVVALDGVPTSEVLKDLSQYIVSGRDLSIKKRAAMSLFVRGARIFPPPANKTVQVSVRRGTSTIIETVELEWVRTGTPLDEMSPLNKPLFVTKHKSQTNYDLLSTRESWETLLGKERMERSFQCSGTTRIAIPKDATVLMKEPFVVYFHPTEKGNVGYVRIPHYMPPPKPGSMEPDYEGWFRRYEWALSVLEQNTVGLIIDQDHNCGGSVDYLHRMVSLFMDTPFKPMQFELRASKTEYLGFMDWAKTGTIPDSIEQKNVLKVANLILESWKSNVFLTPQTSVAGEEFIYPNPVRYSKPIVMLIDEMSGSGGDAFPAQMQGFGRATLVGTTTSGLGGHVNAMAPLNNSGMLINMTQSLFFRPDGVAVENNGAVPDVPYTITRDDFVYGYKNYQSFYLDVLFSKLK